MSDCYGTEQEPLSCDVIMAKLCHAYNTLVLTGQGSVKIARFGDEWIEYTKDRISELRSEIARRHAVCPSDASYAILGIPKPSKGPIRTHYSWRT